MKIFSILYLYLKKDFLIAWSYKVSFVMQFFFIFAQIAVFFLVSNLIDSNKFQEINNNFEINYFHYVLIGICILDIMSTIIFWAPKEILSYKTSGIIEEIFLNQSNMFILFFGISIYPIVISLVKLLIYVIFGYVFFDVQIFKFDTVLQSALIIILALSSFLFIGLIGVASTLLFFKSRAVSILFMMFSIFFGGAYFPIELLPDFIEKLSNLSSFTFASEGIRMLSTQYDPLSYIRIITSLFVLNILYSIIAFVLLRIALLNAKKNATLHHY